MWAYQVWVMIYFMYLIQVSSADVKQQTKVQYPKNSAMQCAEQYIGVAYGQVF